VSGLARAERAELEAPAARTMRGLFFYFLRLGSFGFGGPIALAGYMRRDLVDERGWYSDDEYQQGLAIAQTMPGPLASAAPAGRYGWRCRSSCRPSCS